MIAIDQKADEYAYNEWRDFPEEQAIARRGFKAGAEYVLKLYESGNTSEKEKEQLITELEKENEEMKKGLGCETCQIHLEYKSLNDKIRELEKENEQLRADYDKQKEINIELVDDMADLHIRIRELEKENKQLTEARDILPF